MSQQHLVLFVLIDFATGIKFVRRKKKAEEINLLVGSNERLLSLATLTSIFVWHLYVFRFNYRFDFTSRCIGLLSF
jgi:hypothetical protein